ELRAGLQLPVADGLAQFVGDDARRRLLGQRLDVTGHSEFPLVANNVPRCGKDGTGPANWSPFQTVTWFAVSTGLPTAASRSSTISSVCIAVSGTSTASASGWSAAFTIATTWSGARVPTSAAVTMPLLPIDTTSRPP